MSQSEEPKYRVIAQQETLEIRQYDPFLCTETQVLGKRKEAIRNGFSVLAHYIFGGNVLEKKISMCVPVMQEKELNYWKIRFVLPSESSLETMPKPTSKEVEFVSVPAKRFAVIRFSGLPTDESLKRHTADLEEYILSQNLKAIGPPIFAFYSPPWTLPFMRRNEIMIEIN